MQNVKHTRTFC